MKYKNAQKSNSKYQCKGFHIGGFTVSLKNLWYGNMDVQNVHTIPTPCASTVWISLAVDLMRGFPWDFDYKNYQARFLKHRNTFTFWPSLCNFPWLDRKHSHQSKWKGCSWPPSQFVVGEGPWNFAIQILGGDVGAYMDYINHNKSLILNIVGPFSWHLNDWDCAVFILSLPKCCIEKEQILPCPFPPMNSFQYFYF